MKHYLREYMGGHISAPRHGHLPQRRLLAGGLALLLTLARAGISSTNISSGQRPFRILMILFRGETAAEQGFRDYLRQNALPVELLVRDIGQDLARIPAVLAEARSLRPDLIYTWGTSVSVAVLGKLGQRDPRQHILDIPVVFTMVSSPEGAGLVTSRTASGRNFTGAVHIAPLALQLGAMRAYRPLTTLAVIYNPAELNSQLVVEELRQAARCDGFALLEQAVPLNAAGQPVSAALPQLIDAIAARKPSFLYMGPDTFLTSHRKTYTEAALAAGLAVFAATEIALREGQALFGLVARYENVGQLTARKVEQILRQKIAPQDIPIETVERFSYIVNVRIARQLGLYPPLKVVNYAELIR